MTQTVVVERGTDNATFVARSTNGGATFATPVRVANFVDYRQNATRTPPVFRTFSDVSMAADAIPNDPVAGHQVMPALSAAGGTLSVLWYNSRSEPAFTPSGPVTGQCPAGATTQSA